jgi:glycosyltransferase involved in cell wall biosynthesis
MKKISILVHCFNEEANIMPLSEEIARVLENELPSYDYEIIFIDNYSTDGTRARLREACAKNPKIKVIFNARNFGQISSSFHGLCQTTGDCTIAMCADFQDPPELLPTLVREWEAGARIVSCIKTTSRENSFVRFLRTCYYKTIKKMSDVEMIEHFTGFGLYDKSFIDVLRNLDDPTPWLRGIVAELGVKRKSIPYTQARRKAGKTKNNWYVLYDLAMLSFTSYTKVGLRLATILGFVMSGMALLIAMGYLACKLLFWYSFPMGMAPVVIGVFLMGALQLFFTGLIGEYILSINERVKNRPLVIEEERINFR